MSALMRRVAIALLIAVWAPLAGADTGGDSLRDDLEHILAAEGLTGIAWTLVDGPGHWETGATGLRDAKAALPFSRGTRVQVGSITKAVLATGVLQLASTGRIDVDAPVRNYLPARFATDSPPDFAAVTVRHLLDHSSGLDDARLWQMLSERPTPDGALLEAFPDPGTQLRPRSAPGRQFSYSNSGYTVLAMVIETVTGERYESYLDRELLVPLGMHRSSFAFATQAGDNADPELAWGHFEGGTRFGTQPSFLRPAGQFTTTAADLGRFVSFLLGDGDTGDARIISSEFAAARGRAQDTDAARAGLHAGYALGLGRRDRHGVVGYCHGGNVPGFVAMLCVFPEEGKGFAYSVNTDSETADYGRLDQRFIAALDIPDAVPPGRSATVVDGKSWRGFYVLSPNRFAQFAYLDRLFGAVRLDANDDGSLTLESLQREPRSLLATSGSRFSAADRQTESHVLLRDGDGAFLFSDGFQTYRRVSPLLLVVDWLSLLAGLSGLLWMLVAGSVVVLRSRRAAVTHPAFPAFLAVIGLFVPVPLFFSQSFLALGDPGLASLTLAGATAALPVGMALTLWLLRHRDIADWQRWLWSLAAIFVLQWCAVLAVNGMLPLRLWA